MPVYQSHVGAPDYEGVAARFKPFDLPAAVERGMQAATVMTSNIMAIQKQNAELNLMNVMAPLKVEEARLHVEAIKKQKEISDMVNSPARVKAEMDADDARQGLELQTVRFKAQRLKDTTDLEAHLGKMNEIESLAGANPIQALNEIEGMAPVLGNNVGFQEWRKKVESQIASGSYYDKAKVQQPGSWVLSQYKTGDRSKLHDLMGMSTADRRRLAEVQTATNEETMHSAFLQKFTGAGATPDEAEAAYQQELEKRNIKAKNEVANFREQSKRTIHRLQTEGLVQKKTAEFAEAGRKGAVLPFSGNLGERRSKLFGLDNFHTAVLESLEASDVSITKALARIRPTSPMYADLSARQGRIRSLRRSVRWEAEGFAGGFGVNALINAVTTSGQATAEDRVKIRTLQERWDKSLSESNFKELEDVQTELGELLWDYAMDKPLAKAQREDEYAEEDVTAAREMMGLAPQAGGTAPAGGGLPSYTPEQAANLPVGTEFMGTDGRKYRR